MAKTIYIFFIFSVLALQAPSFRALDVTEFGAIGDGVTDDSKAFLRAWETVCRGKGDGEKLVVPPSKTFMLQPLIFQGPCTSIPTMFQVYGNIVAPRNRREWIGDSDRWILFSDIEGLIVEGDGQIDGRGSSWWDNPHDSRPTALGFRKCNKLRLSGLRHMNSPMAHIHINDCNGVIVSDLSITAPESSPNTDGIDIAGSSNLHIRNCVIRTGDDCIAINSGTSFIKISGVQCGPGHGISVGSLGKDGDEASVEEVYVKDCSFTGTTNGARIKTWQGGFGYARKIVFQGIKLDNVQNPIIIDQYYCNGDSTCKNMTSAVQVSGVLYDGFVGTYSKKYGATFRCSETVPCKDIYMRNINIGSSEEAGVTARGTCFNVEGMASNISLQGLDCLQLAQSLPNSPRPTWQPQPDGFQGNGTQLRFHGNLFVFVIFLSCFIFF